jgi:hypothetical protein
MIKVSFSNGIAAKRAVIKVLRPFTLEMVFKGRRTLKVLMLERFSFESVVNSEFAIHDETTMKKSRIFH